MAIVQCSPKRAFCASIIKDLHDADGARWRPRLMLSAKQAKRNRLLKTGEGFIVRRADGRAATSANRHEGVIAGARAAALRARKVGTRRARRAMARLHSGGSRRHVFAMSVRYVTTPL